MSNSSSPLLKPIITKLVLNKGGYYRNGMQRIVEVAGGFELQPADSDFKPELIIVAAEHYQERQETLPIEELDEIKNLIQHRYTDEEYAVLQYQTSGKSHLNIWKIDDNVPESMITIPESFLLAKSVADNEVLEVSVSEDASYYLASFKNLVHTAKKQGMINSVDRFSFSTGLTFDLSRSISADQLLDIVMANLQSLSVKEWSQFSRSIDINAVINRLVTYCVPPFALVVVYLLFSSLYLLWYQASLESEYDEKAALVGELLDLQNATSDEQQRFQQLVTFANQVPSTSRIWRLVASLVDQATIKSVNYRDGKFVIIAEAQTATDILKIISEHPDVEAAEFTTPIRKIRGLELFNVELQLKSNGQANPEAVN